MKKSSKITNEIIAKQKRRKTNLPSAEVYLRLTLLEYSYDYRNPDDKELLKYYPIAIVACLETFFRLSIKQIIDYGEPYLSNAESILPKNNIGFDVLKGLHGDTITIGDVISHSISTSNLGHIVSYLNNLLKIDFINEVSNVKDRWAIEIEEKPDEPIISSPDELFKYISKTFELRHIFCHETASNLKLHDKDIEKCFEYSLIFLKASEELINQIIYPNAPLTQTDINIQTHKDYTSEKTNLDSLLQELKTLLTEKQLKYLTKANEFWENYLEATVEIEGLQYEGGTIRPSIQNKAARDLISSRKRYIEQLLKYINKP